MSNKKPSTLNSTATKRINMQALLAPVALVIIYVFFAIFGNRFFGVDTLRSILESSYYIGFMAFGITFVIITGGIDLSIGTVMMCSAIIGGVAYRHWGFPLWLALILVPFIGLLFGLGNGLMVAKLKLPSFIATLGTMLVSKGLGSIVANVQTQYYPAVGDKTNPWFKEVFFRHNQFPTGVFFLLAAFIIAVFILNKTKFGRYNYAIGSNIEATRLSGVKTDKWLILIYSVCGLFAGFAGIFFAATYTVILPGSGGGEELNAIAAVVIGGTSMSGGSGTMLGTLIGVFIMSTLKNGLSSVGLQAHYQVFFTGFVVIGAVLLDTLRNKAALKAETRATKRNASK